jgi:putative redox protein
VKLSVLMDGKEKRGMSPMRIVLGALGACASVDVAGIAEKQRVTLADLSIKVEGQRSTEGARPFERMHMHVHAVVAAHSAQPWTQQQLVKAVDLSTKKTCGVHATLAPVVRITHTCSLEHQEAPEGRPEPKKKR